MTSPCRIYGFTVRTDDVGFYVRSEDHWYNQFEMKDMVVARDDAPMATAFPLPMYTYEGRDSKTGALVTNVQMSPYSGGSTISVGGVAPALLGITAKFTYFESVVRDASGRWVGTDDPMSAELSVAVNISRNTEVLWDYALTFDAAAPTMKPVPGDQPPQCVIFPGDYRLPLSAQDTGMLTDDELWTVAQVAPPLGLTGPQLLGILIQLTGARRDAYHPAGHYGISNLTPAQIATGGLSDVAFFVNASVHRQLAVTAKYLSTVPAVRGVLPVFFTLATGTAQPGAATATQLPVNGVMTSVAQANVALNQRILHVTSEFPARLPSRVTPIIGVAG